MSKEIAALTGPLCLEKQGALLSLPSSEKETEFDLKRFTNSSVTSMTQCEWCIRRKDSHLGKKNTWHQVCIISKMQCHALFNIASHICIS